MASSSNLRILSDQALEILRLRGDNAQLKDGARAVSNTSYFTSDSLDSQATVIIPEVLDSVETLRFLEFNATTAETIWSDYEQRRQEFPHRADILNSARRHLEKSSENPLWEHDDWNGAMQRLGLSSNFQSRIMDPEFADMRLSGSLKYWIVQMLEDRYHFLLTLDDVIKEPPTKTLGKKTSSLGLDNKIFTKAGPAVPPRSSSKAPALGAFDPPKPDIATATDEPPNSLPDHLMLWKGGAMTRLESLIREDKTLNFQALASTPPGDFSSISRGLYLTKHEQVAYRYAEWAHKLVDGDAVPVGLLRVAIPREYLVSSHELVGEEWREFVWANRNLESSPAQFDYLAEFQWLVGPICRNSNDQVKRMKDASEIAVWKLAGAGGHGSETASQHYTSGVTSFRLLNSACVGKVWITSVALRANK